MGPTLEECVEFMDLVQRRCEEAWERTDPFSRGIGVRWRIHDDYPHFAKPRGYAVCFHREPDFCEIWFAPKLAAAARSRQDAIIRHELAHALDFMIPSIDLTVIADKLRKQILPRTPERRADALAYAIWGDTIRYDKDEVQTLGKGVDLRPAHLGL